MAAEAVVEAVAVVAAVMAINGYFINSCILTIIKNEHEYLDEWISYHLSLGVNHIFIFEDIDSITHAGIIEKYGDMVSLSSILTTLNDSQKREAYELKRTKRYNIQHLYFRNALRYIKNKYSDEYEWCFLLDCDEFITLEKDDLSLSDVLSLYSSYDAIILQWKCYGSSGHIEKPDYSKNGVIGTYTKEISGIVPDNPTSFVKSSYNLLRYDDSHFHNQHHPSEKSNYCNTEYIKSLSSPTYKNIYIRHYITKSWEEYVWKVKERGFTWGRARKISTFFDINSDMLEKKEELIDSIRGTLVVLPYTKCGSQGRELEISLSLWKKNCSFKYHFIVIGDFDDELKEKFPWVEFIHCPKLSKVKNQYNPHLDVQHKMEIIMHKYRKEYDGFIRMMDDIYAIKKFDLNDLIEVHYHSKSFVGKKDCPTSYWRHDKWKTRQLLDRENLPHINYATHYPFYFEFSKLTEIWKKFNMRNESYCYEDIYFNYFSHNDPILDSTIRFGVWDRECTIDEIKEKISEPQIKFICNSVSGWSNDLENELLKIIDGK